MKASVLIGTLGLTGLAIGLGQWAAPVAGSDPTTAMVTRSASVDVVFEKSVGTSRHGGDEEGAPQETAAASIGADISYSGIYQAITHGSVGNTYAYSLGSYTCNLGNESLPWINNGTPGFASNAYRLHNGRLMQIGTGWVKHACCVVNNNNPSVCSGLNCSSQGFGLRPGCLDIYSASWNSNQARLGPRVNINPYTGSFAPLQSDSYSSITRRLQVHRDELDLNNYPGALYFVEGVYVCTASSQAGNMDNNATHRRATFNQSNFSISLQPEEHVGQPAIYAWQNHGWGVNTPDPDVKVVALDLPGEGRLIAGYRVFDNGDGTWRYEYAIYNLNSHQAAGSLSVGIGNGVNITNVGFHSPPYHSGEQQDMTPWPHMVVDGDSITWTTAQTHAQNPNANAVRWGTMHNFWFTADQPPAMVDGHIGVFIPGAADGVSFLTMGPGDAETPCPADLNGDSTVDGADLLILLSEWGDCAGCASDLNDDDVVDGADLLILLADWGDCP
jgi:hypothetical protein